MDRDRQKWDPGAFDWQMFQSALNGYYLPQAIAGHARFPLDDIGAVNRIASQIFESVEERSTAFFPVGEGGLYHSGVNFRGVPGSPLVAAVQGTIVAARLAHHGTSSTSFVLIRHDLQIGPEALSFFSLVSHIQPIDNPGSAGIPWLERLDQGHDRRASSTLRLGNVALLDERVEAGEVLGRVGFVKRGTEVGAETRFEIFSVGRLPALLARSFRDADGSLDGPWLRRGFVVDVLANAGLSQLDGKALGEFFRSDNLDGRQALRRLAVRHPHEWGDRFDEAAFAKSPELAGLSPDERHRIFDEAIRPYVFWTDALSDHAHLPRDQVIYSYNPITFLAALAAAHTGAFLQWPAADMADRDIAPTPHPRGSLEGLIAPPAEPSPEPPVFGPLVRVAVAPQRVRDIPLISLPNLDDRNRQAAPPR